MTTAEHQDFINEVYLSLLKRFPDSDGLRYYSGFLEKGRTKADFVYTILASDEFHSKQLSWPEVHTIVVRLLGSDVDALKNYPAIIQTISESKKLPSRHIDVEKIKATTFALAGECLVHINKVIPGFGLVLDILDNSRASLSEGESLLFYIDGSKIEPSKYGQQFLLYAPVTPRSEIEIRLKTRAVFKRRLDELGIKAKQNKINVAIVGRFEKSTSIGALSLTFIHQLHEQFNCVLVDTRPEDSRWESIDKDLSELKATSNRHDIDVAIYTDVFSNSLADENYKKVPAAKIKIAYVVFDSTRLPTWWVDSLNSSFDAVITTSKWGKKMIESSGVIIPIFFVPLSLDLRLFDHKKLRKPENPKFRFGSVASFSDRKNAKQLVRCFLDCFGGADDVELVIHTPLSYGSAYTEVQELIKLRGAKNVVISHEELDEYGYALLMNSFDVYVLVSKGECYSITPRQALALGKPAIISQGHAHDEMLSTDLFTSVEVAGYEPAKYEAFNGQAIGLQCYYKDSAVSHALRTLYFKYAELSKGASKRIEYGHSFSHEKLNYFYTNLVSPKSVFLGQTDEILKEGISVHSRSLALKYAEIKATQAKSPEIKYKFQKIVVPVHDGGFFSVFNTFLSHFVWNYGRPDVAAVIPDWRVSTLKSYRNVNTPTSFCYGTESDGNLFTKIFLPIPDMPVSVNDYQNADFLRTNVIHFDDFNQKNEPLLTYVNARELYRMPEFPEWRRRYGRFYRKYFRVNDNIQTKIDEVVLGEFDSNYVIGVHIKHPSHAIEQPGGIMPGVSEFIRKIIDVVQAKELTSFKIFLATDQDAVVTTLTSVFGDRVISRSGVVRTSLEDDARYRSLERSAQMRDGHQIQNLLASDPNRWSTKLAEDVLVDAHLLASCNVFIHVTSNIATAVSYINPDIEMVYCEDTKI